jgi:hypothetical protein
MADKEIRIVPGNPLDGRAEVEDMAEALRGQFSDTSVTVVAEPAAGYGVTAWEVLSIFVSWASLPHDVFVAGVGAIAKEAVVWARKRLKKSPLRPRYIAIYGLNDEILKVIRVEGNGEEIDMTEEKRGEQAILEKLASERRTGA